MFKFAEENEKSEIEKICAKNFETKIEEETEPVLLLIEGSEETCQQCNNLQQKLIDIKLKFTERRGRFPYKMYRMNSQLNEIKNWVFDHVPQLVFVRRNKKIAVFNDEIDTNKVVAFIEERLSEDSADSWKQDL